MVILTKSAKETKKIAQDFAKKFKKRGGVIALYGDLGAGKTTFVQGFAEGLGITEKIISPTFVLIRNHKISNTQRTLYHIDLYRLEEPFSLEELGLKEIFENAEENIVLVEWAEKVERNLPKEALRVFIEKISEDARELSFR